MSGSGGAAVVVERAQLERVQTDRTGMDRTQTVRELQERIRGMQRTRLDSRELPTHPALADLVPGGALAAGRGYAVAESTTLALALAQGPSAAGSWCAIVGLPDLGVGAVAALGLDLDRCVLVPHPGEQWPTVVSALLDVVGMVVVRAPVRAANPRAPRVGEATASRIASRLRQREATLVSVGDWPGAEARLRITESDWTGVGAGFGHLTARMVTVASASPSWPGRDRSRRLWLPGPDGRIAAVEHPDASRGHDSPHARAPVRRVVTPRR